MKHEEKTLQTKKALAVSLKKHMEVLPLNKITVRHLIEDCDINRKTFYYHFRDIYDLLHWTFNEESVEVVKHFNLIDDYESAIGFVMDYVEQNKHILNCALDSLGREHLRQFFFADFNEVMRSIVTRLEEQLQSPLEDSFREFICTFYSEAIAGIICEWIRRGDKYDRHATISNISLIMTESLPNIIMKRQA